MKSVTGIVAVLSMVSVASGTVLIFERDTGPFGDFGPLPQGYGDRVTATVQNGFAYSLTGGPTPNVVFQHSTGGLPQIYTWTNDYGDLQSVIFAQEPLVFEVRLVADPGYQVVLHSFDMACWPHLDYLINSVQVIDGNGNVFYSQSNLIIEGDGNGPPHSQFAFSGAVGNVIRIIFDSTNQDSDDIGLDNIAFSQTPGCAALPDGDANESGSVNGSDMPAFVGGVLSSATDAGLLCHVDFNGSGVVDQGDIPGFVAKLLGP